MYFMRKHFSLFLFLLLSIVTSAQTKLQVVDDSVRISNGELIIRNNTKDVQGYLYNTGNGLTQFKTIDATSLPNPLIGPKIIGGTTPTSTLTLQSTSGVGAGGDAIIFRVGNNGASEAMRVVSSGSNGFVGIGTSAPGNRLSVSSGSNQFCISYNSATKVVFDMASTGRFMFNLTGTTPYFLFNGGPVMANTFVGGTSPTSPISYKSTTAAGTDGADHIFQVGNNGATEAMRILNNGNVGIGTSTPSAKLHINDIAEQQRISYDADNYVNTTVSSTGAAVFNGSTSSTFQFSKPVGFGVTPNSTVTLGPSGTWRHYNTSDQTTNTEYVQMYWSGNQYNISSFKLGTGSARDLHLAVSAGGEVFIKSSGGSAGFVQIGRPIGTGTSGWTMVGLAGGNELSHISGSGKAVGIFPTIAQSGTGGYMALFISPYEQSTGSGAKYLIDAGINSGASGSGTHSRKFSVDNTGAVMIGGTSAGTNTIFDMSSTTKASKPRPSMTEAQRILITPDIGAEVYQTDGTEGVYIYKSTGWQFAY